MKIEIIELHDPWAVRERAVIVQELEGLPGFAKALIDELIEVAQSAGGSLRTRFGRAGLIPARPCSLCCRGAGSSG
jgi:hypothetical protein